MKITTIGAGLLLLAGCGAASNDSQVQANGAAAAPPSAPAPAPSPPSSGGIVPPGGGARPGEPFDASLPIPGPPELSGPLVGRWGRLNSCAETLEFFADGRVVIPDGRGGNPQWRVSIRGRLELIENGSSQAGAYEVRDNGRILRLTNPSGRKTDFIRC